jgi:hypothetical protein
MAVTMCLGSEELGQLYKFVDESLTSRDYGMVFIEFQAERQKKQD